MIAILTKFIGPTNHRGARIKAWRADDTRTSVTVSYDYAARNPHADAVVALCARLGWTGTLVEGGTKTGSVFVWADRGATVEVGTR